MNRSARACVKASAAFAETNIRRAVVVCLSVVYVSVVATIVASNAAHAADQFYVGTWNISAAVLAPWADPKQKPDGSEQAAPPRQDHRAVGQTHWRPQPVCVCRSGPHYKVRSFTADLIFRGAFGDMQSNNKAVDPNRIAASLGFSRTGSIKTLETGCEIDFHFVDDATAQAGLNDYVYTLKKQ